MKQIYTKSKKIYLGLGSNLGNKIKNLNKAIYLLNQHKITVIKKSDFYITNPWGYTSQKTFCNAVVEVKTNLKPLKLLKKCQSIEKKIGKRKKFKWGPRIIDIDILIYKSTRFYTKRLTIPHKYITQRLFVLLPLAQIDNTIKLNGVSAKDLIDRLKKEI